MRTFPHSPATFEQPELGRVSVIKSAWFENGEWVIVFNGQDAVEYQVDTPISDSDQEVRFRTSDGVLNVIRSLRESDSELARNHPFFPAYPLPVEIIGAIVNNQTGIPTLYAAVADDGAVHTMVLWTDVGLYARYSRTWVRIQNTSVLGGMALVEVGDDDLDVYDQADEVGRMLTRGALSEVEMAGASAAPIIERRTMTASAHVHLPLIASLDDAATAIQFATENTDARWFVERRLRALRFEGDFPWA